MNNLENVMLAWSMNENAEPATINSLNSFKFKLAVNLNKRGLLLSRIVRHLVGINYQFLIDKVEAYLQNHPQDRQFILDQFAKFSNRNWGVQQLNHPSNHKIVSLCQEVIALDSKHQEQRKQQPLDLEDPQQKIWQKKKKDWLYMNVNVLLRELEKQRKAEHLDSPVKVKNSTLIQNFIAEAVFLPSSPIEIKKILKKWAQSVNTGDYFIQPSATDSPFWRLYIATEKDSDVFVCTIKKEMDQFFLEFSDGNQHLLMETLEDLENKLALRNIKLGKPALPIEPEANNIGATEPHIPEFELEGELDDVLDNIGVRTKAANAFLKELVNYQWNAYGSQIEFNHQLYTPIASNQFGFSKRKLISCGSSHEREFILCDFERSPLLKEHYKKLVKRLKKAIPPGSHSVPSAVGLSLIMSYIRKEIFPYDEDFNLTEATKKAVKAYKTTHPKHHLMLKNGMDSIPVVPIDYFVEQQIGVCRHHALVAAMLIDKLMDKYGGILIPKGIVQHVRDNMKKGGAHVWVVLIEPDGTKWHFDTLWQMAGRLSNSTYRTIFEQTYGATVLRNQDIKTDFALRVAQKGLDSFDEQSIGNFYLSK
jgi:hypothetical protein